MSETNPRFRRTKWFILTVTLFTVFGFSGEDGLEGNPWHHEHISEMALREAGYGFDAYQTIAWHADYVDSYLYNPLWWGDPTEGGGLDRFKVSMATYDELAKLHFDDLFDTRSVNSTWRRYLTGTVAGLVWAGEHDDVAAAHNLLGLSLHAIQDFYSHSNWMDDPDRRLHTWFTASPSGRDRMSLWTGAYERDVTAGVRHHGKIAPACSILRLSAVSSVMADVGCLAISPLSNTSICHQWEDCKSGRAVGMTVGGVSIPSSVVYLAPPGIAIDNTWVAEVGGRERGLLDESGNWRPGKGGNVLTGERCRTVIDNRRPCLDPADELFATAKQLATQASLEWLVTVDSVMSRVARERPGVRDSFWVDVKSQSTWSIKEAQYERYNRFPYQFLSAGPYPPGASSAEEYYLRVLLETSRDADSGTNADIVLQASGASFVLDYLPGENPILAYDDFEGGDRQVYTVGPFASLPANIVLQNRSANAADVARSFARSFGTAIDDAVTSIGDGLLSLVSGHADLVASNRMFWTPEDLRAVGTEPAPFHFDVNGGDEGHFRIFGSIRKTGEAASESREAWVEYEVILDQLLCVAESDWDRGSDSDEPLLLIALVPLPGDVETHMRGPYDSPSMDSGDRRPIDVTFRRVRLSRDHGSLSLPITVMESDDESRGMRRDLHLEFRDRLTGMTREPREGFLETLGRSIAADWKLGRIEVTSFTRGDRIQVGTVLDQVVNGWIEGGEQRAFPLNPGGLWTVPVTARDLEGRSGFFARARDLVDPAGELPLPFEPPPPPIEALPPAARPEVARPRVQPPAARPEIAKPQALPPAVRPNLALPVSPPPGNCSIYDPARLRIEPSGDDGWQLVVDGRLLQRLASREDAERALQVFQSHTHSCLIGHGNDRPDRRRYIFTYPAGGPGIAGPMPGEDCLPYRKEELQALDEGERGWLVTDGQSRIQMLDTQTDAQQLITALKAHSARCFIGRDNHRADRLSYIMSYLKR